MLKRAQLYYRNPCSVCEEAKSFLEDHGVIVLARNIIEKPLDKDELDGILGYHDPKHFLDSASPNYAKQKLDKNIPLRGELLNIIEKHPDLLRQPIVVSGRLMTVGSNRKQLIQMFQLTVSDNGSGKRGKNANNGDS